MPLPLTVSCLSKIQIGSNFLVPAHPGSPGIKWPLNGCVCVCVRACVCVCVCVAAGTPCNGRRRAAANAAMRAVPRCQLTQEAEHRLVLMKSRFQKSYKRHRNHAAN